MNISWPVALIVVAVIAAATYFVTAFGLRGMSMESDKSAADKADDYRKLLDQFSALSEELKKGQADMAADLADVRAKVDSVERMMREVG